MFEYRGAQYVRRTPTPVCAHRDGAKKKSLAPPPPYREKKLCLFLLCGIHMLKHNFSDLPKSKSRFWRFKDPMPPMFLYPPYTHSFSICVCVCVSVHGGEAYLACYHFLNDLCFQHMMDCLALIDINFPEPGKKKKSFTHRKSMLLVQG